MADLQYGQALMLACCGNQVSLSNPPNGGYLCVGRQQYCCCNDRHAAGGLGIAIRRGEKGQCIDRRRRQDREYGAQSSL